MDNVKTFVNHIFNSQPFSRFMGATLEDCGTDFANISLAVSKDIQQQHGFVHGGALSYLADNSITFAGGLALGGDAVTSKFKINYLKPAKGVNIIAQAKAVSIGTRQAVCQCEIFMIDENAQETLCAIAQGTVVKIGSKT